MSQMSPVKLKSSLLLVLSLVLADWFLCSTLTQANVLLHQSQESAESLFAQAITLNQSGQYAEATKIIVQLIRLDPGYIDQANGSAWYQFGKTVKALNGSERAFRIWLQGLEVFKKENLFDPYLSYEFTLLSVHLQKKKYYQLITEVFYELLEKVNIQEQTGLLRKIYAQCDFLLPAEFVNNLTPTDTLFGKKSKIGLKLSEYWRKEDVTPSTLANERLIEHLQRVAFAREYNSLDNTRGFDDRGMIYIKLGPPIRKATALHRGMLLLKQEDMLPHEVWSYDFIKQGLYFPFVDIGHGKGFELVKSIDKAISIGLGINRRIVFYNELAIASPIIYRRIHDILNLLQDIPNNYSRANSAKLQIIKHMDDIDYDTNQLRADFTPDVFTDVLSNVKELPIQVRTARFLEEDGATRLELYFGFREKDLMMKSLEPLLPSDTLQVKLAVTVEDKNFKPGVRRKQTITAFTGNDRLDDEMVLFEFAGKSPRDSFYVSGQVETWYSKSGTLFDREDNSELKNIWQEQDTPNQTLLKLAAFRTDIQRALRLEKTPLLISDIQLSSEILVDAENPTPNKGELYIAPYPYSRVDRKQLLYLYFEIYGLERPENGEAKYRIAFEAEDLKTRRSIWSRIKSIFGEGAKGKVELESEYTADTPNPREWIALDLNALSTGEIKLTVKVTDLLLDETAERSVTLELF